jgi:hypothetical protein
MVKKHGNIPLSRSRAYEAFRRQGKTKKASAKLAWAGRTRLGRHNMAIKAAHTRKMRGGH